MAHMKKKIPTTVTVTAARTVFIKRRGKVRYFITRKHEREEGSRISCLRSAGRLVALREGQSLHQAERRCAGLAANVIGRGGGETSLGRGRVRVLRHRGGAWRICRNVFKAIG